LVFFFSSRRRHTRSKRDWSSDVCSSDLHSAHFSPSGDKIACFGHEYEFSGATLNELFIFDVHNKQRSCLSNDWDFQLGDVMIGDMRLGESETGPVWSKDEKHLYFIGTDHGATGLYEVV